MNRWILAIGIAAACGATEGDSDPADPFRSPSYTFCQPGARIGPDDLPYCALLDDIPAGRCPGLAEACREAERDTDPAPPPEPSGCDGASERPADQLGAPPAPDAPPVVAPPPASFGAELLVEALRWTVAFAVGVLAVAAIVAAVRALWTRREKTRAPAPIDPPASPVVVDLRSDEVPEAPPLDLLGQAESALAAGRLQEALWLARAAALRGLADRGRLTLHVARTDREYVRSLSRDPDRQAGLRRVLNAHEAARWGGGNLDLQGVREVLAYAGRLILPAVLAAVIAAAEAWAGVRDHDLRGSSALVPVLQQSGLQARWRTRTVRAIDHDVDVLYLDAERVALDEVDGAAIRAWVEDGGVLVVFGQLSSFPELGRLASRLSRTTEVEPWVEEVADLPSPRLPEVNGSLFDAPEGASVLVKSVPDGGAYAVFAVVEAGRVVGVADGSLLRNGALLVDENQRFMANLPRFASISGMDDDLVVEVATVGGEGSVDPFSAVANTSLLPLILQFLLVAVAFVWWRAPVFGVARDLGNETAGSFADHARALASRYRRIGASRRVAAWSAALFLRRRGTSAVASLARRHGQTAEDAQQLQERVRALAADPDGPTDPEDFKTLEALWHIHRNP